MQLRELQKMVQKHGKRFKDMSDTEGYSLPNHVSFPLFKAVEELGEVSDLLVRKYGPKREGKDFRDGRFEDDLGEELVDVITTLIHLANFSGIDLTEAFERKLQKMDERWKDGAYQHK